MPKITGSEDGVSLQPGLLGCLTSNDPGDQCLGDPEEGYKVPVVFAEVAEVENHQPRAPCLGGSLAATSGRADCVVEMVAYLMKKRVCEHAVAHERDVHQ